VRANTYYQSLILHNSAGPLGTAASLHAALAIPNVTLLEAPWANHDVETDVCWPYPEIVDGYALPLEGLWLGIEFDEALAGSKPFVPALQGPRPHGLAEWVGAGLGRRGVTAGFLDGLTDSAQGC